MGGNPKKVCFLYVETSLHAGDAAISDDGRRVLLRDTETGLPCLKGSTLTGAFRNRAKLKAAKHPELASPEAIFGDGSAAAAVEFCTAQLLFLPLRSARGTFLWVTSPGQLKSLAAHGIGPAPQWTIPSVARGEIAVCNGASTVHDGVVVAEEFSFRAILSADLGRIASDLAAVVLPDELDTLRRKIATDLCLVDDADLKALSLLAVEVIETAELEASGKLPSARGFGYTEYLPSETVLYSVAEEKVEHGLASLTQLHLSHLQIGADETKGRGICRISLPGAATETAKEN